MKFIKHSLYFFILLVVISVGIGYFYYEKITVITMINSVFLISLAFIMIGSLMFVTRGGFFDAFTLSFRRFMKKGTKMGEIMDDVENMALPSEAFEYNFTEPMLISGLVGFLVTVLLSFNM